MESQKELSEIENIEIKFLLEAIYLRYGYNFKNYAKNHIKRRIKRRMVLENLHTISQMTEKLLYSREFFQKILLDLSINTTEMFRFPDFYLKIREEIVPFLKTYPSIKIWHAGCSTGEEVYSMAILLKEAGLLGKAQIFATDINEKVLRTAKDGIYPLEYVKKWTSNYQKSGGKNSFSDYYMAKYNSVIFDSDLMKNTIFMEHNLVSDKSFLEANLIICRNVFIYFNNDLQDQVLQLFLKSLKHGGFLGLGSKENIKYNKTKKHFEVISSKCKIYKKIV